MDVFVAGGTGFVGRSLCRVLAEQGHSVTAASRSPSWSDAPSDVETVSVDVTESNLVEPVRGHDAVVNLVALPSHREPSGQGHEAVHLDGTRHLVAASEATGVERFVQMSGLGVDSGVDTAYFRAKRRAEAVVRESALDWVVYRPSVVFGDGCAFLPFIRRIVPPVVAPLPGGGEMRIQPIWVQDLAPMLAAGVTDAAHVGRTYEIGGPEKLTLAETVRTICGPRIVVPIPLSLAGVGFRLAELVPGISFGMDQFRVFELDNTVADNDASVFGLSGEESLTLGAYCLSDR
jgi:NADH dehydrogenase